MFQYKSSAELKDFAKGRLTGHYGTAILAMLLIESIQIIASSFITMLVPGTDMVSMIISLLLSGVVAIFLGIYQTGVSLFYLNMACGHLCRLNDIFYGMQNQPSRSLVVSLAVTGVNLLCLTPYQIFAMLFMNTENLNYMMLMLVSAAIGLLIYVPVSLALSQSYYLLLDFPEYSGKEALKASCKLMKGHMGRLFYIQASFLPLMFLGILTCGIGMLWITPYMNMTYTLFFLDIMNPAVTNNSN
ncbi:MAG: DUF975 family protein [Lachnospiraceae bacterium]|nr:DUF975 family protein [Lachnospiraceae bacterium]